MNKSEQINELAMALAKAQGEIKGAIKDTTNPYYGRKYADLSSVWDACREPLSKNGLSVLQTPGVNPAGQVTVETILMHLSGQWISGEVSMTPVREKKGEGFLEAHDPQAIGSAISYARRYALASFIGIYQEDDDGNKATGDQSKPMLKMPLKKDEPVVEAAKAVLETPAMPVSESVPAPESLSVRLQKALAGLVELTGREPVDLIREFSSFPEKVNNKPTGKTKYATSIDELAKRETWGNICLKKMDKALEIDDGIEDVPTADTPF